MDCIASVNKFSIASSPLPGSLRKGNRTSFLKGDEVWNGRKAKAFSTKFVRKQIASVNVQATSAPEAPSTAPQLKTVADVSIFKIAKGVTSIRGKCNERFKFEIEYGLNSGTTENSYLIRGASSTALIDVPDQAFQNAFVEAIAGEISLADIDVLILGHLSPKRVKSIEAFAKARPANAPRLKVFCSNPAAQTLTVAFPKDAMESLFQLNIVKSEESLDLGGGHRLQFILAPTPRWPDSLLTYDPSTQLLFSQKLFSAHVSSENGLDVGGWDVYGQHWRFFYDCMLAPVARQVDSALDKLPITAQFAVPSYSGKQGLDVVKADLGFIWSAVARALNLSIAQSALLAPTSLLSENGSLVVSAICPLHGPIVRSSLTELVREYKQWTVDKVKQAAESTVAVIYASAYGNTSAMAQAISRGILKAGVGCETLNCEVSSKAEVAKLIKESCGFVIGSPTLGGHMPTPVQEALGVILSDPDARSKPCGVFGSFGWSGEAVDELEKRLKDGGYSFAFPSIRCKFKPTEQMVQICEESGTDLAQLVKKKKLKSRSKDVAELSVSSSVEQAVGRIVGALCVVSAKSGDAESAMLASWVSQASFNPPGITLAVAKDRAVEGLVLPGGSFVLNILGGDKVAPISRQLLKAFKPGEPRYGALETVESATGGKILKDAIAFLECEVVNRMETGDHWVLYATVVNGNLQDDKSLTAVHYRKTGSRY